MIRRLFIATTFSGLSRFFSTGANMLFVWAVSRHLPAAELGIYGILFFFTTLFSGISPLGYPTFIAREVAHRREQPELLQEIYREGLSAFIWGTSLSILVWLILAFSYSKVPPLPLSLAVWCGVLWGAENLLTWALIGLEENAQNSVWNAVGFGIVAAGIFLPVPWPITLSSLFLLRLFSTLVGVLGRLGFLYIPGMIAAFRLRLDSFKETLFYWLIGWINLSSRQLDVLLLSFFLSDADLGAYFLSLRIFLTVGIVSEVVGVAVIPFASRIYKGRETRSFNWLFTVVLAGSFLGGVRIALGMFLTRGWLLGIFNDGLIPSASPLLAILVWAVPFNMANNLVSSLYNASVFQRERFFISLILFIVSTGFLIPLAHFYSVSGAAWVKLGYELLRFLVLSCILWKRMGKGRGRETRGSPP